MSFLSDIGASLFKSATGTDPAALQAQLNAAEEQLQLAVETVIGQLTLILAGEVLIIILLWKMRRD